MSGFLIPEIGESVDFDLLRGAIGIIRDLDVDGVGFARIRRTALPVGSGTTTLHRVFDGRDCARGVIGGQKLPESVDSDIDGSFVTVTNGVELTAVEDILPRFLLRPSDVAITQFDGDRVRPTIFDLDRAKFGINITDRITLPFCKGYSCKSMNRSLSTLDCVTLMSVAI